MNTRKTLLAASVVTLGLLSYPGLSQAFDGDHHGWSGHHCARSGDTNARHGWARLADRLNLSNEQRASIKAIFEKYRPELRELRQLSSDNRTALAKMDVTDPKLQELADAQGKTMSDAIVLRMKMRDEMGKVLTIEQRQMATKILEQRGHRRGWHDGADRG